MATLKDLREGLAANLAAHLSDTQVSAYMLANPTTPAVHIVPGDVVYDRAMSRGLDEYTLLIQAFTGLPSEVGAQMKLDEYLAPSGGNSIKEAAESDQRLGGVADAVQVTLASGYRTVAIEGRGSVLMAEWTARIFASGN